MPELPEVEHVVRALRQAVTGRRIIAAQLRLPRTAPLISSRIFARKLKGARIEGVRRRGKYILIELSGERVLLVHLRMTGKVCAPIARTKIATVLARHFLSRRRHPVGVLRYAPVWPDESGFGRPAS